MANTILHKGNFVNVTFDGATDFDLCDYLGVKAVTLFRISQNAVAVNDSLTVRDGGPANVAIYGPYKDTAGGGLVMKFDHPRVVKPYVLGTEATAASKVTFEVEYVKT